MVELKVLIIRHIVLWYFAYLNNSLKSVWEKSEIPTKLQMLLDIFIKDRLEEPRQLGQISAYSFVTRFFLRLPVLCSCMHNDDIIVKLFYSKFCTNE